MISDPYTALNYILQTNSNITSLLGVYQGTSIPLIKGGDLPETETDLPALTFYNNNMDTNREIEDSVFTINCYAGNTDSTTEDASRNSFLVAKTIVKELNGGQSCADGYAVTTTCRILATIPDPTAKEANTAVEIRLFNINGGA